MFRKTHLDDHHGGGGGGSAPSGRRHRAGSAAEANPASGEVFPLEEIATATPASAAAFREQTAVLRAAALIREMRETAGFTQRELARLIGTSQPHLSDLERGTGTQGPSFVMLDKIANACGRVLRIEADEPQGRHGAAHAAPV